MDDDVEKSDEELYMKNGAVYSAKRILDAVSIGDLVFTTDGSANVPKARYIPTAFSWQLPR